LCFRKLTQEIFSELDETKAKRPDISWSFQRTEEELEWGLMTHKYRGCIVVLSINKSVKHNEEQKVLMSGFDQGFTVNTSK
jgi:hypothetical protein